MDRQTVYAAVDNERDYQDQKWGPISQHPHEVGAWICILESLITEAREAWRHNKGDIQALGHIREVAATTVACMEQHGVTFRAPGTNPGAKP